MIIFFCFQLDRSKTLSTMVTSSTKLLSNVSISVDDIYNIAERERLCYSARGRRNAVTRAQNKAYKVDEVYKSRSRPHTSASGYIDAYRRDVVTPTKSIRSEPLPSRVSSRTGRDFEDEEEAEVYPMNYISAPSVCCEIIGPQACEECRRAQRRQVEREKFEAKFSNYLVSDQNITTCALLQRYLPHLSREDILMKVARGDIASPNLLSRSQSLLEKRPSATDTVYSRRTHETSGIGRAKQSMIQKKIKSMFFVNIQDLNTKINSGKVSRSLGFNCQPPTNKRVFPEFRSPFPSFVSPRKVSFISEASGKKFHYEPPLLPKENQIQEPGFFAGSESTYQLPERLPDTIEFVQNGKTVKRAVSTLSEEPETEPEEYSNTLPDISSLEAEQSQSEGENSLETSSSSS